MNENILIELDTHMNVMTEQLHGSVMSCHVMSQGMYVCKV